MSLWVHAFGDCPLLSENKILIHPTNECLNSPNCLQMPHANRTDPLLPANLKIYTRFSASASQLGCHSMVQKQSWYSGAGAECDSEVPTDWAHSQMHVTQTRVQSHCSFLTENLTNLTLLRQILIVFLF